MVPRKGLPALTRSALKIQPFFQRRNSLLHSSVAQSLL